MNPFDIKETLNSIKVLVDTREQDTERARRRLASIGMASERKKIEYGDYTYSAKLPSGSEINAGDKINPKCVIERKMDLDELAMCLGRDRKRFEAEFKRAKANDARVYLLVENGNWQRILAQKYRTKMHPNAFLGSLTAFMIRYNANVIFCSEYETGRLIREILYRDLKERLERGEYDNA